MAHVEKRSVQNVFVTEIPINRSFNSWSFYHRFFFDRLCIYQYYFYSKKVGSFYPYCGEPKVCRLKCPWNKLSRYFVLDETFNLQILEQCSGAVDWLRAKGPVIWRAPIRINFFFFFWLLGSLMTGFWRFATTLSLRGGGWAGGPRSPA